MKRSIACLALALFAFGCDDDDNAEQDAAIDAGSEESGSSTWLSYVKTVTPSNGAPKASIYLYDFEANTETEITGAGVQCTRSCVLSPNRDYVGWMMPGVGGYDCYIAPVDENGVAQESGKRLIANQVTSFDFTDDHIVYMHGESISGSATIDIEAEPLKGCEGDGCKSYIASVDGSGAFRVVEQSPLVIVAKTTLSTMELSFYNLKTKVSQSMYTFGQGNSSGSEFSGRQPIGLSPDSSLLAVLTRNSQVWRANSLIAMPNATAPTVHELFETSNHESPCGRPDPYRFTEVQRDPVFSSDSKYFYFLAHGDCTTRGSGGTYSRDDYDILKLDAAAAGPVVNVTRSPRISSWANHDIKSFDLSFDNKHLAFIAPQPYSVKNLSIWVINPENGEYDCSRGDVLNDDQLNAQLGSDTRNRCEFIFDHTPGATVDYRDMRFHR